jgi:hypothetical protein
MSQRVTLLAVVLLSLAALAGAATLPPAPAAPSPLAVVALTAPTASLAWMLPAPNSSVEKPDVNGKIGKAPLGAIFKSGCTQDCLQAEIACGDGCGGDHSCNLNCSNDYYCCLDECDPNGPQCP